MLDSVAPVDKKCRSCRKVKLLTEYDFSTKSKNGRAQECKECKERKVEQHKICICPCPNCKDEKLLDATYSLMELCLTRIEEGTVVSDDFRELVVALAGALLNEEDD